MIKKISLAFFIIIYALSSVTAQTWVDTLDAYARLSYLPASHYHWTWQDAALLNTMVKEYNMSAPAQKQTYLSYIKTAMDKTYHIAKGKTPNGVASGLGMAFLYSITKDEKYKTKADQIYAAYLRIRQTKEGGVSHLLLFTELWDDTVFMIGEYLISMYQATGDRKYIEELAKQIRLHRDKLQDKPSGLWYHGWDQDTRQHCTICSQEHWPDQVTGRSAEIWGRANGWIVVTLSDALEALPQTDPLWPELAGYLKEMIVHLPELQDKKTGHWYQLPVRNTDPKNFIESSCTAMFGYAILTALQLHIVSDSAYNNSIALAYQGLRTYSITPVLKNYLTTKNICTATCIGDKKYYFKRPVQNGKPYGIGMFIQFGEKYERYMGMKKTGGTN